jgi:Flp pilus assembly protein TadG
MQTRHTQIRSAEAGQSMAEFALVLPILLLVVLGGLQLGAVFLQSQQLSAAVSEGARRAIVSSQKPDRDAIVQEAVVDAAPNLDAGNLDVATSGSWTIGQPITVSASYPVSVNVLGLVVYEDTISNQRTMRVAN